MKKRTIKKMIAMLVVCIMLVGMTAISFASGTEFTDLPDSHWAYQNINAMVEKGIIKGYEDGSFKPNGVVTYGEFLKMIVIALTNKDPGISSKDHWALNYYDAAREAGLLSKDAWLYDAQPKADHSMTYAPKLNGKISRGEMAGIIAGGVKGEFSDEDKKVLLKSIKDSDTLFNADTVLKVYGLGILSGYSDGTFKRDNTLTRAECAAVIARVLDESQRKVPDIKALKEQQSIMTVEGQKILDDMNRSTSTKSIAKIFAGTEHMPDYAHIKYYEIVSADPYGFKKYKDTSGKINVACNYNMTKDFMAVLVKDGSVYGLIKNQGNEKIGLSIFEELLSFSSTMDFDYIGFAHERSDTMFFIANPFK